MDIWHLRLAFQYPIKHNLATHQGSENVVVKVTTADGAVGYGEGVPRGFVTGELLYFSKRFLMEVLAPVVFAQEFAAPQDLPPRLAELYRRTGAQGFPGAFCALETALLDAAGRTFNMGLADLLGPPGPAAVTYSAVIPMLPPDRLARLLALVKEHRLGYVKVKVGHDADLDVLQMVRQALWWEVDLRVDANGAWTAPEALMRLRAMAPFRLSAVEQPVAKEDFLGLRQVQEALDIPVIADESLCHEDDARRLLDLRACRMFNLRLSKCGGLTTAWRIQEMAAQAGVASQLGCHVGETSILSAAGRHYAMAAPALTYLEGSLAPFVLAREPVSPPVVFGPGGQAGGLPGPGLGITVQEAALADLAVAHQVAAAASGPPQCRLPAGAALN